MEDVVIYRVDLDSPHDITSWGRDSLEVATEFCRRPKYPAKLTDSFIGVDDWGHGNIVCATPEFSNWIGTSLQTYRREAH